MVGSCQVGGEGDDVAVIVERVVVVEDEPVTQVDDLLQLSEPVHADEMLGRRGEPHEPVVVEQQPVRAVVQQRYLAAQHAVRVVIEHEVLLVAVVAEYRVQAVAQVGAGGRLLGLLEPNLLDAEQLRAGTGDGSRRHAAVRVGRGERDGVLDSGDEAQHRELVLGLVLLVLCDGLGEVRVSVGVDGVADRGGLVGGEVHVQRHRVRAVRVRRDEDAVESVLFGVALLGEVVVGHLLVVGGVDVLDGGVEPFDALLVDRRAHGVVREQGRADRRRDDDGGDPFAQG